MTVSSTASRIAYTGNGSTTAFAFAWRFLATTDIAVYVDGTLQSTGYSVSSPGASGTVTFVTAPANGASVVIRRATAQTQETDYVANDAFSADVTELAFDRAMLAAQDNAAAAARCIRAPDYAAALDMTQFYGMGVGISASGAPVPLSLYTGAGALANASWQVGRNAADSASLNMWRINAQNFLEQGTCQSYDNTGAHTNRGVPIEQSNYDLTSVPAGLQFLRYHVITGQGDNTGFKGVGHEYIVVGDRSSVNTNAERGVLYGTAYSMRPRVARNNAPSDDVAAVVISNDGVGVATEAIYIGRGLNALANEWIAVIGSDANATYLLTSTGAHANGIDFHKIGAPPATFTGAAMHVGNNAAIISARNAANSADLEGLKLNTSNQWVVGGWITEPPTSWVPASITSSGGSLTTASAFQARYNRAMGRCWVDLTILTTTVGTASGTLQVAMPYTAASSARFVGNDAAGGVSLRGNMTAGSNILTILQAGTGAAPWSNGNYLSVSGSFEVAS